MREFLKLPEKYIVTEHSTNRYMASEETMARLAIAGLVDVGILWRNGEREWPAPLLLLDGQTAREDYEYETHDSVRRHFYGPSLAGYAQFLYPGIEPEAVVLAANGYAFHIDISQDPQLPPSAYLGHGVCPDNATAVIFDEPIPYDQELFEERARAWCQEFRTKNDTI